MSDCKKATSWIYTLKKEDLVLELEKRGLSIEGSFAVLCERLLRAEGDDEGGSEAGSTHKLRDSGIQTGTLTEASSLTPDIEMADYGSLSRPNESIASRYTSQPVTRVDAASRTEYGFSDLTLEENIDEEADYSRALFIRVDPSDYKQSGPSPSEENPFYVDTRRREVPLYDRDPSFRSGRTYGRESGVRFAMSENRDLGNLLGEECFSTESFKSTRAARRSDSQSQPRTVEIAAMTLTMMRPGGGSTVRAPLPIIEALTPGRLSTLISYTTRTELDPCL